MSAKGSITSLPAWCVRRLDADGTVGGKTWRDMPGRGRRDGANINRTLQAFNWWLWKRGLLNLRQAKAEARAACAACAACDAARDEESGVAS